MILTRGYGFVVPGVKREPRVGSNHSLMLTPDTSGVIAFRLRIHGGSNNQNTNTMTQSNHTLSSNTRKTTAKRRLRQIDTDRDQMGEFAAEIREHQARRPVANRHRLGGKQW